MARSNSRWNEWWKPTLDTIVATTLLVVLSPLILVALALVRLTSKGPAIYAQRRLGLDGKIFTLLKIRSMYLESEREGPRWSLPGDPRVTPIGSLLRWTHMDELPQLVNVVRGEMSLIGPRPERPEIVTQLERCLPHYGRRLAVRPGISGLAQVLQAPDTNLSSVRRKLSYDIYYATHLSWWFDLRITAGTVLHLLGVPGNCVAAILRFPFEQPRTNALEVATAGTAGTSAAGLPPQRLRNRWRLHHEGPQHQLAQERHLAAMSGLVVQPVQDCVSHGSGRVPWLGRVELIGRKAIDELP
jgi:lipopolysaccharide/colanic/teichoic acid biosynthesis glycosyltransferase